MIVSHYTATLNVIEKFCARKKYTSFRLDGLATNFSTFGNLLIPIRSTKIEHRQMYVDQFNRCSQAEKCAPMFHSIP